jgi:hypothetical protein
MEGGVSRLALVCACADLGREHGAVPGDAGGARQLGARRGVAPGRPLPAHRLRRQDAARLGRGAHALPQDALRAPALRHQPRSVPVTLNSNIVYSV